MGRRRVGKRTVTVTGALLSELLGDPGPDRQGPAVPIPGPGSGCPPPTHCPVCRRRIDRRYLVEHLGCYHPDAHCSVEDVAEWFRLDEDEHAGRAAPPASPSDPSAPEPVR
jgi:hypothetical protein